MKLRAAQAAALSYEGGPLGISAIPGSGKTFIIAALAAHLLERMRTTKRPGRVLIVTYQNTAVDNVRRRVDAMLRAQGYGASHRFDVRTLHSLSHAILHRFSGPAGLPPDVQVLDASMQQRLLMRAVEDWCQRYPDVIASFRPERKNPKDWAEEWPDIAYQVASAVISTAKNMRLSYRTLAERLRGAAGDERSHVLLALALGIYERYQSALDLVGGLDYDDLVWRAVDLLDRYEDITRLLLREYPYILEDEAQDSVPLQEALLRRICGPEGNLVRVGDPNQAISSTFTSAEPRFFRAFLDRIGADRTLLLSEAGRSAPRIIHVANYLVDHVTTSHPEAAVRSAAFRRQFIEPTRPGDAQPNPEDAPKNIAFRVFKDRDEEFDWTADRALRYARAHPDHTLAILVPANWMGAEIASRLARIGAPYDELLNTTTTTRHVLALLTEVLDALAHPTRPDRLAAAYDVLCPLLSDRLATERPDRTSVFIKSCYRPETLLFPLDGEDPKDALNPSARFGEDDRKAALALAGLFRRWHLAAQQPAGSLALLVARDVLPPARLGTAQRVARYLWSRTERYPSWTLPDFVDDLRALRPEQLPGTDSDLEGFEPRPGIITLTTMFKAKGLEWDLVYLIGVNPTEFPYTVDEYFRAERRTPGLNPPAEARAALRSVIDPRGTRATPPTQTARLETIAERLRLLYVCITRARRYLSLSASGDDIRGEPTAEPFRLLEAYVRRLYDQA